MVAVTRLLAAAPSEWVARVAHEKRVDEWLEQVPELAGRWGDWPSPEAVRAEPLAAGVGSVRIG